MQANLRNFVFTINNWEEADIERLKSLSPTYLVYGKEVGESGTHHLQGYAELARTVRFTTVTKILQGRAHLEPRKGTPRQASDYCKKDKDFVEEGTISNPGKRTDLESYRDFIKAKRPTRDDLYDNHIASYDKYRRLTQELIAHYHKPEPRPELDNWWFWGESGSGKTSTAQSENPGYYMKNINKWWDSYDGEDCVIIEEWCPELEPTLAQHLKRWADHYPFQAEVKCGTINIRPKRIIVTSNFSISECFQRSQNCEPILRRFKERQFFLK